MNGTAPTKFLHCIQTNEGKRFATGLMTGLLKIESTCAVAEQAFHMIIDGKSFENVVCKRR